MSRQSKKFRSGRNPSNGFVDAATHITEFLGPKWSIVLGLAFLVGFGGFVNHVANGSAEEADAAEQHAVEVISHRPDGVSEKCRKNLVRSYFAESSVERYEREQLEANVKSGNRCEP